MSDKNELVESEENVLDIIRLTPPEFMPEKPFSRNIFLLQTFVAGIFHVKAIDGRLKKLKTGEKLVLRRQPKNKYDKLAILVLTADEKKLGYVPKAVNPVLARLMDAGKCLYAVLDGKPESMTVADYTSLVISIFMED